MSFSSNSRKESTDSYASQQMQNGGAMPGMDQLTRFNQPADRPEVTTERIASGDTDFSDDYAEISDSVAAEGEETTTETDNAMTGYRTGADSVGGDAYGQTQPAGTYVEDADWNASTEDGSISPNRANEPDRTLGNS
jgi:hypothetical protein